MAKINSIPINPNSSPRNSPSSSPSSSSSSSSSLSSPPSSSSSSSSSIRIVVPNPPTIKPLDYIRKKSNGKWPTKPPNSFILYRIAYSRELKLNNVKLSIQETSKLVSNSWDNEKKSVKTAYKNLAVEIDKKLLDLRNENSISDQDIYFYNHDHLSIEQLKDYYFSNQQLSVATTNTNADSSFLPSLSRESQKVNSSIGNNDSNACNIANNDGNSDGDHLIHRNFMQQQQNYDSTVQLGNIGNVTVVSETNNNVNNVNDLNSSYVVVDGNNSDARQNYHQNQQQQQQQFNSSMDINYSLPNIRNDYQSVYKFNNSSDIGLIAAASNENVLSTNFLLDYQNKDQCFIDISNYDINNNDNYINNLNNNFNATNDNNNHLSNTDNNNFNFNNINTSHNFNFNSNNSNNFNFNTHSNNNFNGINNNYLNNNNEFQDFLYY